MGAPRSERSPAGLLASMTPSYQSARVARALDSAGGRRPPGRRRALCAQGRDVFGRRKREEAAAEAARESQRRALFEKLAERPENICPFLGLAGERTGYVDGVSDEHRCYAFGDPAPLSAEQQTRVCQQRGYGNCPRYLRGVLVIPTEELEALRRPRAASEAPPPPMPPPVAARDEGRRRVPLLALLLLLLLVGAGGAGAY